MGIVLMPTGTLMKVKQTHPHFTAEGATERLCSAIPGAVVEATVDEANVWVAAVFDAPNYFEALKKVRQLLLNGVDVHPWPDIHVSWAPNQREWDLGVIRKAVVRVLGLREDHLHIVKLAPRGFTLIIYVETAGMFDLGRMTRNEVARARNAWRSKVMGLDIKLPEGLTNVVIKIGEDEVDWAPPPFDCVDGDDSSDDNPNWPSTTGNPSGTGRGNNPPRR